MIKNFAVATRFYGLSKTDLDRLVNWIETALKIVEQERIFIAIRKEIDLSGSYEFVSKNYPKINIFQVTPWGKVVQAPNALLIKCAEKKIDHVLFISTEYELTSDIVNLLKMHFDDKTLVVGVSLPGHKIRMSPKKVSLIKNANGLEIPWNTYALWSVRHLMHTGFVLVADSLHDPDNAGMEEMGTIAVQQILWPKRALAKLVMLKRDNLVFNTKGWTIKRHERYLKNLKSKNTRASQQLKKLVVSAPKVLHIGLKS